MSTRRYVLSVYLAIVSLTIFSGCAAKNQGTQATDVRVRCRDAGRNAVRLWRCMNPAERTAFMQQLVRPSPPADGTADWSDAIVLSTDNAHGLRLIPVHLPNDKWEMMVWKLQGEFETYLGSRNL
jgi:hypothetical protein